MPTPQQLNPSALIPKMSGADALVLWANELGGKAWIDKNLVIIATGLGVIKVHIACVTLEPPNG